MWIIFNKLIPVKGFWMMTLWFIIFVREDTAHGAISRKLFIVMNVVTGTRFFKS